MTMSAIRKFERASSENTTDGFLPAHGVARRWNRDWGVEATDLIQAAAVGDRQGASANGADFATESFETSSSPLGPFQPKVSGDGFFEPQAALADSQRSGTHG